MCEHRRALEVREIAFATVGVELSADPFLLRVGGAVVVVGIERAVARLVRGDRAFLGDIGLRDGDDVGRIGTCDGAGGLTRRSSTP